LVDTTERVGTFVDFTFTEDQESLRGLVAQILDDHATPARTKVIEDEGHLFDTDLWSRLAAAELLALCLPEEVGGGGAGLMELGIVLEEAGRHVARVPLYAVLALGALPVARFGGPDHRDLLRAVGEGAVLLTAAHDEPGGADPLAPTTSARPDGTGWRLEGCKIAVPYGPQAERIVTPASLTTGGTALFLVDPRTAGAEMAAATSTSGEPLGLFTLDGAWVGAGDRLGAEAEDPVGWAYRLAVAAQSVTAAGVLDGGLRITADYIAQRQQFGRPIAAFQGAAMRIADAYIDTQAVWISAWSAMWHLGQGLDAAEALAIAKFWVADGGQRAVHAFQHLHGGIGLDVSYPIHRYFTVAKSLEASLGGATSQLMRLGALLAAPPDGISDCVA
jgi:alkylation response protein AidB-like acyl-CoA dehydrogenase